MCVPCQKGADGRSTRELYAQAAYRICVTLPELGAYSTVTSNLNLSVLPPFILTSISSSLAKTVDVTTELPRMSSPITAKNVRPVVFIRLALFTNHKRLKVHNVMSCQNCMIILICTSLSARAVYTHELIQVFTSFNQIHRSSPFHERRVSKACPPGRKNSVPPIGRHRLRFSHRSRGQGCRRPADGCRPRCGRGCTGPRRHDRWPTAA